LELTLRQYSDESILRLRSRGISFASTCKLVTGDVRKAPRQTGVNSSLSVSHTGKAHIVTVCCHILNHQQSTLSLHCHRYNNKTSCHLKQILKWRI